MDFSTSIESRQLTNEQFLVGQRVLNIGVLILLQRTSHTIQKQFRNTHRPHLRDVQMVDEDVHTEELLVTDRFAVDATDQHNQNSGDSRWTRAIVQHPACDVCRGC